MNRGRESLSIIIPAFKEAGKITADVAAALTFLVSEQMPGEVIVVDDCSQDGTAQAVEAAGVNATRPVRAIRHEKNQGKGAAVRTGVLASKGDLVLFADAGCCIPFNDALRGLAMLGARQCEIAHASRRLALNSIVRQAPPLRRFLSAVFRRAVPFIVPAGRGLTDTQCGFKLYRGSVARQLYAASHCNGWLFDLEIIALAAHAGHRIHEFPVTWRCDRDSRVHPVRHFAKFVREAIILRQRQAILRREDPSCSICPIPALP